MIHLSLTNLIMILEKYKYFVLFPIAIFEGPIVTVVSGFLIASGYLNGVTAYILILIADTIGDALHYLVGILLRHKRSTGVSRFLRIDKNKIQKIEAHFKKHPKKTIIISKLAHGIGGIVQIIAGIARMPFVLFLGTSFLGTLPKSLLLLYIGYTFGMYLPQIDNYLSLGGLILFGLTLVTIGSYFTFSTYINKKV